MIVTCPVCRTRYRVDDQALARPAGRAVRCAACGHSWHHPPSALAIGPLDPTAVEDRPRPRPALDAPRRPEPVRPAEPQRRHHWLLVGFLIFVVLIVLAVLLAIAARSEVVAVWSPATRLYDWLGFPRGAFGEDRRIGRIEPQSLAAGLSVFIPVTKRFGPLSQS